jgi:alkylation response protein AidB-like acyl-CoA dehydrogenase
VLSWAAPQPQSFAPNGLELSTVLAGGDRRALAGRLPFVPHGDVATHLVVAAQHDGSPVLAVVRVGSDGLHLSRQHTMDITRRYVQLTCTDVAVEHLVTEPAAAAALFEVAVVLQCAESVGIGSRLLEMTVDYAGARTQFDRPIGSFQAIKHKIADMLMLRESARAATRDAEATLDTGDDARLAVSVAKSLAGAGISRLASEALQIHGGIGFTWEHDLHLFLRRAKVNELLLGTSAWHDERITALLASREI